MDEPQILYIDNGNLTTQLEIQNEVVELIVTDNPIVSSSSGSLYQEAFNFVNQPVWIVNHNLNQRPHVEVYSTGGVKVLAEVHHLNPNMVQVSFDGPFSGQVIVFGKN